MPSPASDRVQWALIVQRLMDADLLLPEEGNALLTEIQAWNPPVVSAEAQRAHADQLTLALHALLQTDRLDASARQAALETARALMHPPDPFASPMPAEDQSCQGCLS